MPDRAHGKAVGAFFCHVTRSPLDWFSTAAASQLARIGHAKIYRLRGGVQSTDVSLSCWKKVRNESRWKKSRTSFKGWFSREEKISITDRADGRGNEDASFVENCKNSNAFEIFFATKSTIILKSPLYNDSLILVVRFFLAVLSNFEHWSWMVKF